VEPPKVLAIADAPNWARTRFGLDESELDMRIMRGVLGCEHVGVSYIRYGPGFRITLGHRHPGDGEEIYVLVEGSARMKVGDTIVKLEAPAAIRVHGDVFRAIRADGNAPAVFVVSGTIDDPDETEFAHGFWPDDE
jgi:uncharacterized cupin superfamily protein